MIYGYFGLILLASLITTADKLIHLLICVQDAQLKVEEIAVFHMRCSYSSPQSAGFEP